MKNFRMQAKGDRGEIYLYGDVGGGGWFTEGVTAKQFADELKALGGVKTIDLRINSAGGDVFDGWSITNLLNQHPARIVVHVDGLAASIASVIAMAGDEIRMGEGSYMMIHNAWGVAVGDAGECRRYADLLDGVSSQIADTYAKRCKKPVAEVRKVMDAETWFTASDAKSFGLADVVDEPLKIAASLRDASRFRRPPSALLPKPNLDARAARLAASAQLINGTRGARE